MNAIVNIFLLTGDKFMPEINLRQPGFTYSTCSPFTKHKQRIQKFTQTGDTNYIYKNELDKACFAHDVAYSDSRDLAKRTESDKVLRDKAFEIANNPKYDGYQRELASMVYKFFVKKSKRTGIKNKIKENEQLANELHKPIIRKFRKRKVSFLFRDNFWGADLADMYLISKCNKGIRYLLCASDLFSKYAFVIPLRNKKGVTIANASQSILDKSKRKPNKIWTDQGSDFYNTYFKKWLKSNPIIMYSTHNEGKSIVAERFIRTLKNKIYKHMTAISKNIMMFHMILLINTIIHIIEQLK